MKTVSEVTAAIRLKKNLCIAWACKNKIRDGRKFCFKCLHKIAKERDPVAYQFQVLKSNAKRRGHECTLTVEEFRRFCDITGYITIKGKYSGCAHVDRIDPRKGYSADNIQIMESSSNCRKRWVDEKLMRSADTGASYDWDSSPGFDTFGHPVRTLDVAPF